MKVGEQGVRNSCSGGGYPLYYKINPPPRELECFLCVYGCVVIVANDQNKTDKHFSHLSN